MAGESTLKEEKRVEERASVWKAGVGGREREWLGPSFYMFSPPRPALCKVGSARTAALPEVLTPVLAPFFDLPLFYFHRLSPSLSFSHRHFGLLFPILPT